MRCVLSTFGLLSQRFAFYLRLGVSDVRRHCYGESFWTSFCNEWNGSVSLSRFWLMAFTRSLQRTSWSKHWFETINRVLNPFAIENTLRDRWLDFFNCMLRAIDLVEASPKACWSVSFSVASRSALCCQCNAFCRVVNTSSSSLAILSAKLAVPDCRRLSISRCSVPRSKRGHRTSVAGTIACIAATSIALASKAPVSDTRTALMNVPMPSII